MRRMERVMEKMRGISLGKMVVGSEKGPPEKRKSMEARPKIRFERKMKVKASFLWKEGSESQGVEVEEFMCSMER